MVDSLDFKRESVKKIGDLIEPFPLAPTPHKTTPEEQQRIDYCFRLLHDAQAGNNKVEDDATEHMLRHAGKWTPYTGSLKKWPRTRLNLTHIMVEMDVAMEQSASLKVSVKPQHDPGRELECLAMEQLLQNIAQRSDIDMQRHIAVKYGLCQGTRVFKVQLTKNPITGDEDILIRAIDPRTTVVAAEAQDDEHAPSVHQFVEMSFSQIQSMFGKEIAAQVSLNETVESPSGPAMPRSIFVLESYVQDDTLETQSVPILPDRKRNHAEEAKAENDGWQAGSNDALVIDNRQDHLRHAASHGEVLAAATQIFQQVKQRLAAAQQAQATLGPAQEELAAMQSSGQLDEARAMELTASIEEAQAAIQAVDQIEEGALRISPEMLQVLQAHIAAHNDRINNPPLEKKLVPKYPYGRITINTQHAIMVDTAHGFPRCSPLFFTPNYAVGTSLFGTSDVSYTKYINDNINRLLDKGVDIVRVQAGILRVPKGFKKQIVNEPHQMVEMESDAKMDFVQTSDLSSGFRWFLPFLLQCHDIQSGIHESTVGKRPRPVITGEALKVLAEAAQQRPNTKVELLRMGYARMFKFIAKLISTRFTGTRVIRIAGQQGQELATQIDSYHARLKEQKRDTDMRPAIELRGQYRDTYYFDIYPTRLSGDYDIQVDVGLDLRRTAAEDAVAAGERFKGGTMDLETYLTKIRDPDKDAILQRLGKEAQFQQAVSQLQEENAALKKELAGASKQLEKAAQRTALGKESNELSRVRPVREAG